MPRQLFCVILIALIGFLGGSFPVIIAHGRNFFPPHLVGRGVTLMNLFGIGGAGLAQFASACIHEQMSPDGATQAYVAIFGFFGLMLLAGTLAYLFSRDSMD